MVPLRGLQQKKSSKSGCYQSFRNNINHETLEKLQITMSLVFSILDNMDNKIGGITKNNAVSFGILDNMNNTLTLENNMYVYTHIYTYIHICS